MLVCFRCVDCFFFLVCAFARLFDCLVVGSVDLFCLRGLSCVSCLCV